MSEPVVALTPTDLYHIEGDQEHKPEPLCCEDRLSSLLADLRVTLSTRQPWEHRRTQRKGTREENVKNSLLSTRKKGGRGPVSERRRAEGRAGSHTKVSHVWLEQGADSHWFSEIKNSLPACRSLPSFYNLLSPEESKQNTYIIVNIRKKKRTGLSFRSNIISMTKGARDQGFVCHLC